MTKTKLDRDRNPILGEFFTTESVEERADSIVRESIQNSLDAALNSETKVHVRFAFGVADFNGNNFGEGLWEHVSAADTGGYLKGLGEQKESRFLVVEDFGTTGLRGDPEDHEPEDDQGNQKKENEFYYFLHAEGKSSKSGADRGSWGVGKYTFLDASRPNLMIVYTVRSGSEDKGGNGPLVMGISVLPKVHKVGNQTYKPDGYWADIQTDIAGEEMAMPFDPESDVPEKVKQVFGLKRSEEETGLSIVVPYLYDEFTASALLRAVVRNYGVAIGWGSLTVEIEDEEGNTQSISNDNIREICSEEGLSDQLAELDLALWGRDLPEEKVIELAQSVDGPNWDQEDPPLLTEDQAKTIRDGISEGNLKVRVPIPIRPTNSKKTEWSYFDIYFAIADSRVDPHFYRGGLRINKVSSQSPSDVRALVIIEDPPLASFLGDAEGPAHKDWDASTKRFKGRYRNGRNWIAFIKRSPAEVFRLARSALLEEDKDLAIDYFYVDENDSDDRIITSKKSKRGGKTTRKDVPELNDSAYIFSKKEKGAKSGFEVKVDSNRVKKKIDMTITVAYDVNSKANAFSKYTPLDFDLAQFEDVQIEGGTLGPAQNNKLSCTIEDPKTFRLRVFGFDPKRDLKHKHEVSAVN